MSLRKGLFYLALVDVVANATNYAAIRLGFAGSVEAALIVGPTLYAALLALGFKLRGGSLLEEYGRNAGDSLRLSWGYFGISLFVSAIVGGIILAFIVGFEGLDSITHYQYPSNPIRANNLTQTLELVALSLVVVGPAEETIFRGASYGLMLDHYHWTKWRRLNLIQALGFGLAHLYYLYTLGPLGVVALAEIVGMGYGLGWAYYKCGGSLAGPIIVHGLWDGSSFLLLYPATSVLGGALKALFFILVVYSIVGIALRGRGLRKNLAQKPS